MAASAWLRLWPLSLLTAMSSLRYHEQYKLLTMGSALLGVDQQPFLRDWPSKVDSS